MNCISWNVGHLAWQEQEYFLWREQGRVILPEVRKLFAYGAPGSEPRQDEMLAVRQLLGHARLPTFVGNIDDKAPYLPEL